MESFLKEVFKDKYFPCQPEVEIADRVGPATKSGGQRCYFSNSKETESA